MIPKYSPSAVKKLALEVLDVEHKALELSRKSIGAEFLKAVDVIAKSKGRVVVLGIGKRGLIGRKGYQSFLKTGI